MPNYLNYELLLSNIAKLFKLLVIDVNIAKLFNYLGVQGVKVVVFTTSMDTPGRAELMGLFD